VNGRCERCVESCGWKNLKDDTTEGKVLGRRLMDGLRGLLVKIGFSVGRL